MINDTEFGSSFRRNVLRGVIALVFVTFVVRLAQMQLVEGSRYGKKSLEQGIRRIPREPVRGAMYDRNGKIVVANQPSFVVYVTPYEFRRETAPLLASILGVDTGFIFNRVGTSKTYTKFTPMKLARDADPRILAALEENRLHLPGVDYQVESKRKYEPSTRLTHLLGYVKEISQQKLDKQKENGYYVQGDMIGWSGLESKYEDSLRGERGFEFAAVNAFGQRDERITIGNINVDARDGCDLHLGIDIDLQSYAEELLNGRPGAAVAIDPNTGDVLAYASKPDYDLSVFSGRTSSAVWDALSNDQEKPLYNRVSQLKQPPGSTFKMVLATAALNEGIITSETKLFCPGSFTYGDHVYKCHGRHGSVDVKTAIRVSCNVFFYQLMLKTGFTNWTKYGAMYGFGKRTGIDIPEESPGILPSEEYYNKIFGVKGWTKGYLVSLAIGQGEMSTTPLQEACYAGALATGLWVKPHVVRAIYNKQTKTWKNIEPSIRPLPVKPEVLKLIREGMYGVVNEGGGTGHAAGVPGIAVAGKTGTAQNPHGKDHAWFVGFAPLDSPKIAVAVFVENAGFGGTYSAPIAGRLIEYYLTRRRREPPTEAKMEPEIITELNH